VTAGGDATCGCACCDPISSNLYDDAEAALARENARIAGVANVEFLKGRIEQVPLPRSIEHWVGCVAGALTEEEYRRKLDAAGFTDIDLETTRVHGLEAGLGAVTSAFVRAKKPLALAQARGAATPAAAPRKLPTPNSATPKSWELVSWELGVSDQDRGQTTPWLRGTLPIPR
jgi:hypothetical protein